MKCLVTGGCGFIGSKLVEALCPDHNIDVFDVVKKNVVAGASYLNFPHYENYDVIFHLGAVSSIRASFQDPVKTASTNIIGTVAILDQIAKTNVKLVFCSSCTVYCDEHSPYSLSKKVCEDYCEMYRKLYNTNISIARIGNAFGETDHKGVINRLLNQHKNKELLTITGDGSQTRDFIHVDDIVSGLIEISKIESGTFDVCSGEVYSLNEIAHMIGGEIEYVPLPPCEGFHTLNVACNIPNWKPKIPISKYLKSQ